MCEISHLLETFGHPMNIFGCALDPFIVMKVTSFPEGRYQPLCYFRWIACFNLAYLTIIIITMLSYKSTGGPIRIATSSPQYQKQKKGPIGTNLDSNRSIQHLNRQLLIIILWLSSLHLKLRQKGERDICYASCCHDKVVFRNR